MVVVALEPWTLHIQRVSSLGEWIIPMMTGKWAGLQRFDLNLWAEEDAMRCDVDEIRLRPPRSILLVVCRCGHSHSVSTSCMLCGQRVQQQRSSWWTSYTRTHISADRVWRGQNIGWPAVGLRRDFWDVKNAVSELTNLVLLPIPPPTKERSIHPSFHPSFHPLFVVTIRHWSLRQNCSGELVFGVKSSVFSDLFPGLLEARRTSSSPLQYLMIVGEAVLLLLF